MGRMMPRSCGTLALVAALTLWGGGLAAQPVPGAVVSAIKTGTGSLTTGGTVTYTVILTNSGPGPQADNPGDEFVDVLPAELLLVNAAATSGASTAFIATNTVTWNGSIPSEGSVTISIFATVVGAFDPCQDTGGVVSNQGTCAYDSDGDNINETACVTDDPFTQTPGDPTVIGPVAVCVQVPTLSEVGLVFFCLALTGASLVLLRRR